MFFLRKCQNAENRKKIKNILRKAKKAREVGQSTVVAGVADVTTALEDNAKALGDKYQALEETAKALDINAEAVVDNEKAPNSDASAVDNNAKALEDKAKNICWFCHEDVTKMKNCICAGCKKVIESSSLWKARTRNPNPKS